MRVKHLKIEDKLWEWKKQTYIMGILNVTPDSFSDGGSYVNIDVALTQAKRMIIEGADIIDVGGETTKPGAIPVSSEEEIQRVIPFIEALSKETSIPISVDTYRAKTAEMSIKAGAHMINDIWGLKYDPEMAAVVASYDVPICIMHNRTTGTVYENLIEDMKRELEESLNIARKAGIKDENIILDPGIGFAKTAEQNLEVMRHMDEFEVFGYPILLGASRKRFIGKVLELEVTDRLEGTLAVTAFGITKGADIIRVHDVLQNVRVAKMIDSMVR